MREGKNRKDRAVPIGAGVCALLESYIAGVRADWPGAGQDRHLFLNRFGQGMGPMGIWQVVRKYSRAAGIDRAVSTHTFRHSCATHMLRAGPPVRHLQECWVTPQSRPLRYMRGSPLPTSKQHTAATIRGSGTAKPNNP